MATRVAVIGVGSMGRNHARVYNELPEAELVAVCDENEAAASGVGKQFGVRTYSNYHTMLAAEKPEAVTIAVPTALHEEVALAVLEAGVHTLIEKPIAATVEEGHRIIRKAAEAQRVLMIGHIVRFNPAMQALKQKLQDGELGKIFQVFCRRAGPFPARIRDVGVVVDLAPHDVDIMRFLTGAEPVRVFTETEQRIHTDHEDLLFGLLRFPDGIIGALEINWLTPTKLREVLVLGELGMFRVDDLTQDLYFYENAQANRAVWPGLAMLKGVSEGSMLRFALQRYEPLKAELQSFLKAVRGEAPVAVTGEDGLAALRLALALVESGEKHQVIEV
ncbi:MAG: Gfo/Idh/MocA family oxidoreductase [Anaerolineaceae bacterium]|nr:Gfo/Idh/MocA family oxidoreductase [Anaerolineaceae bacterium]